MATRLLELAGATLDAPAADAPHILAQNRVRLQRYVPRPFDRAARDRGGGLSSRAAKGRSN